MLVGRRVLTNRRNIWSDFDAWVAVAGRLHGRSEAERQELLARVGISHLWDAVDRQWCRRMVDAIGDGDMEQAFVFNQSCADHSTTPASTPLPFERVWFSS